MRKRKSIHGMKIVESSGNVYADLGFRDAEAMLMKAQLVTKINELIKRKGLTQTAAGELLGLPKPKLSAILRGRFHRVSEFRLMDCITRLGSNVEVVVKAAPRRHTGKLSIIFS
ncbi:MAG: helix-turn-helix domain-containing protein [Nitrososphaera sp.]|nr:helix-turn-helix domain-containing protein [Nitrososphaera sp.]